MEKHERIVRDLNNEFKKVDRAFATNEMRIFGANTGRIYRELDVVRRKQIDLATEHVSLESIQDIPQNNKQSKTEQQPFTSLNFDKKETMLRNMMQKLDDFTQAMETFHKICEIDYHGNETLIVPEDYATSEDLEYTAASTSANKNGSIQYLTLPNTTTTTTTSSHTRASSLG